MKAKRFFSFLLVLTMMISLTGGICLPATAASQDTGSEDFQIPPLELSGIPGAPEIGRQAEWDYAIVPEGAGYTAEFNWHEPYEYYEDPETGDYGWGSGPVLGVFEAGKDYRLCVEICLNEDWIGWNYYEPGDYFNVEISVNGGAEFYTSSVYSGFDNGELFAYASFERHHFSTEEIHTVEVFGMVEPVCGEVASEDAVYVPEDAPYEILRVDWITWNGDTMEQCNGEVFAAGNSYRLDLVISPAEGYHFADDCKFYANGMEFDEGTFEPWIIDPYMEKVYCFIEIDKVELSYEFEPPVVGESPEDVAFSIPEDANYEVLGYWYEVVPGSGYYYADTFLPGTEYCLEIMVYPFENYSFSENVEILINGIDVSENENVEWYSEVIYFSEYVTTDGVRPDEPEEPDYPSNGLEIVGVQEPVAGEYPTTEGISVSGDIPCTIEAQWYELEYDYQVYEYIYTEVDGAFETGKQYGLGMTLVPLDGYSFPEEIRVEVIGCDYWWFYPESPDLLEISPDYFQYDLRYAIRSVEITGVTDAVIGQRATTEGIEFTADGNCTVSACWYEMDDMNEFSGVFQDNTRYVLMLEGEAAEGYRFDLESVVVNGVERECYSADARFACHLEYDFRDLIHSVEIEGLQEPEIGQPASTEGAYIKGNPPCELDISWYRSEYAENEYTGQGYYAYVPYDGVFEAGYMYSLGFEIVAADGYYFSDDCQVSIQGETIWCYGGSDYLHLPAGEYTYQFGDIINRISVTLPGNGVYIGEQISEVEIDFYSSAPCTYSFTWYTQSNTGSYAPFTGTFGNERYWLVAELTPAEGYSFSDCMISYEDDNVYKSEDYLKYQSGKLYIGFMFDFREEVDAVWLTSTDVGGIGAIATNDGISVQEGANYTATAQWNTMELDLEAGESELLPFEGKFRDDTIYLYMIDILPAEGYRFSDDLTIWFNDQLVDNSMVAVEEFRAQNRLVLAQTFTGNLKPVEQIDVVINCTPGTPIGDAVELSTETEGCFIYQSMCYSSDEFTGSFVEGVGYGVEAIILPEEGYYLSTDLTLNILTPGEMYLHNSDMYAYAGHFLIGCLCQQWPQSTDGDLTGDAVVDNEDVAYLLWHTLFPEDFPISANVDFNDDGLVDNEDVAYLLWHTLFPEDFPI